MSSLAETNTDTVTNHDTEPEIPTPVVIDASGGGASISEKVAEAWFNYAAETHAPAVVIVGTPNGTIPSILHPFIHQTATSRPVFIISTNYAYNEGPIVKDVPYELQTQAAEAGAILLRDVNINGTDEVLGAIGEGSEAGLASQELRDFVLERFGTPAPLENYTA